MRNWWKFPSRFTSRLRTKSTGVGSKLLYLSRFLYLIILSGSGGHLRISGIRIAAAATVHQGQLSLQSLPGRLMSSNLCKWVIEVALRCGRAHRPQHLPAQDSGTMKWRWTLFNQR